MGRRQPWLALITATVVAGSGLVPIGQLAAEAAPAASSTRPVPAKDQTWTGAARTPSAARSDSKPADPTTRKVAGPVAKRSRSTPGTLAAQRADAAGTADATADALGTATG